VDPEPTDSGVAMAPAPTAPDTPAEPSEDTQQQDSPPATAASESQAEPGDTPDHPEEAETKEAFPEASPSRLSDLIAERQAMLPDLALMQQRLQQQDASAADGNDGNGTTQEEAEEQEAKAETDPDAVAEARDFLARFQELEEAIATAQDAEVHPTNQKQPQDEDGNGEDAGSLPSEPSEPSEPLARPHLAPAGPGMATLPPPEEQEAPEEAAPQEEGLPDDQRLLRQKESAIQQLQAQLTRSDLTQDERLAAESQLALAVEELEVLQQEHQKQRAAAEAKAAALAAEGKRQQLQVRPAARPRCGWQPCSGDRRAEGGGIRR
jgi:hypothetical protein